MKSNKQKWADRHAAGETKLDVANAVVGSAFKAKLEEIAENEAKQIKKHARANGHAADNAPAKKTKSKAKKTDEGEPETEG